MPCRWVVAFLLLAAPCGRASAQTTKPTDATEWNQVVKRLADAVRGKDLGELTKVFEHNPVIRTFTSDTLQPPERLLGTTTGSMLIGVHAYSRVPSTLATDLAEDFQAPEVPEHLRQRMIPPDGDAQKRANETAAQWLVQSLQPTRDQPVAVIVLWRQDKTDAYTSSGSRPIFLLIKGQLVDGQYVFRQVTFGDPLESPR